MKLRVLLVNPWIYDFAAYNLWVSPLGLLKVAEHLSSFDTELKLIDCLDAFTPRSYGAGRFRAERVAKPGAVERVPKHFRRYGIALEEFSCRVRQAMPFDAVLMTSLMTYWYPGVRKAIEMVRDIAGDVPVVLGGLYATVEHRHAVDHSGADFVYKGSDCGGVGPALHTFGFRLRPRRPPLPYYRLGLGEPRHSAPLLTSRGCPYRCPYCASGLLSAGYQAFDPEKTIREISDLAGLGVRDFAFFDDALLVEADRRFKLFMRGVADRGLSVRFHSPNGLHARFLDRDVARLMRRGGFRTIRLSLETVDPSRQSASGGKVTTDEVKEAVGNLAEQGFARKQIGVYLMYGLPGQGLEEVREGVRFLKQLGVRIHLTEFSPIRGTVCWEGLVRQGLIEDDMDPLLTNNSVYVSFVSGHDHREIESIKLSVKAHNTS